MAKAMLGQWDEAASDLHAASRLDHDEEISAVLKKVLSVNCSSPPPVICDGEVACRVINKF